MFKRFFQKSLPPPAERVEIDPIYLCRRETAYMQFRREELRAQATVENRKKRAKRIVQARARQAEQMAFRSQQVAQRRKVK